MNPAYALQYLGQSLWLDNISREILQDGSLQRYIDQCAITGLTSNPTIFEKGIRSSTLYDHQIHQLGNVMKSGEELFFAMALDDLKHAADLFTPCHKQTHGVDGWVSLEVSPLFANAAVETIHQAKQLYASANKKNLFIKIPGTPEGLLAIKEAIFAGVPINVTLLFSCEQYLAAADAYMSGIEARIAAGLDPKVSSVASVFVSRWDVAADKTSPVDMHNQLGIAVAQQIYTAYRALLISPRWRKLAEAGAQHQRLLWASTGVKDLTAPDTLYVQALAAPDTINTIPEKTLMAFMDHGVVNGSMPVDGSDANTIIAAFLKVGIDHKVLAIELQKQGVAAFAQSWAELMAIIKQKSFMSHGEVVL